MMASLLGTGVVLKRLGAIEFDFVVSFKHSDELSFLVEAAVLADNVGLGALEFPPAEALEKKPRMLCCLPVDGACPSFFAVDGVRAGVRDGVDFSPILAKYEYQNPLRIFSQNGLQGDLDNGNMGQLSVVEVSVWEPL